MLHHCWLTRRVGGAGMSATPVKISFDPSDRLNKSVRKIRGGITSNTSLPRTRFRPKTKAGRRLSTRSKATWTAKGLRGSSWTPCTHTFQLASEAREHRQSGPPHRFPTCPRLVWAPNRRPPPTARREHHCDAAPEEKRFGLLHLCFSLSRLGFKSSDDSLRPAGLVTGGNERRTASSRPDAARYTCVSPERFHQSSEHIYASISVILMVRSRIKLRTQMSKNIFTHSEQDHCIQLPAGFSCLHLEPVWS